MILFLLRRGAFSLFSLAVVSAILFLLTRSIPDPPARTVLGPDATDAQVAQFDHDNGLDRPVLVQYGAWIRELVVHGNLGRSFITGRMVDRQIISTMPVTLETVTIAFTTACAVSLVLGTLAALMRDTIVDYAARLVGLLGISLPGFWLALC